MRDSGPSSDDRDLRERFGAERERDRARVPAFARVVAGRARPPVRSRWVPALVVATMVVVAVGGVVQLRRSGGRATPGFALRAGDLRTPTDFLLDLASPTLELGMPRLADPTEWFDLPALEGLSPPTGDESERL